ncbi:MAG: helix-turn-helix domain-containing protein [Chloroflexota bacterium]
MKKDYPVQELFKISDLETLKTITHPQRIEILQALAEARTVKEIAAKIDADPTKLYYHIRQLEKANIIQVVETNLVSGILEKTYLVTAKSYQVDETLFTGEKGQPSQEDVTNLVDALLKNTQLLINRSIRAGHLKIKQDDPTNRVESGLYYLTPTQAADLNRKINAIKEEFSTQSEANREDAPQDSQEYMWTNLVFPVVADDEEAQSLK